MVNALDEETNRALMQRKSLPMNQDETTSLSCQSAVVCAVSDCRAELGVSSMCGIEQTGERPRHMVRA
jgi:hypothetical protein